MSSDTNNTVKIVYTPHIDLCGRGVSDSGQQFCKLLIHGDRGTETLLVREAQLQDYAAELEAKGANLVTPEAMRELARRVQANGLKTPTLKVATRIEIRKFAMALPGGPYPPTRSFEVALTDVPADLQAKFTVAGNLKGWRKLARLGRGNSRLICAFSLGFVGPLSAVLGVEHVALQLVGEGGEGKSGIGVVSSSTWGWDPNPVVADRNGFGQNWNSTVNALERTLCAYNQTMLFLNEAGVADGAGGDRKKKAAAILDSIFKIEGAVGKARLTDTGPKRSFFVPVLSTSNKSVIELVELVEGRRTHSLGGGGIDPAYVDRLADIPPPQGGHGMFETLHGLADVAAFVTHLKRIAAENHGVAGRAFVGRLLKARRQNRKKLTAWVEARRAFYVEKATAQITSSSCNLTRLHGKFATIYAAGAMATRFGILPHEKKDIFAAILACERDHVRFIEQQLAVHVAQPQSHIERLRDYLRRNASSFIDLRQEGVSVSDDAFLAAPGFVGEHKRRLEYLFPAEKFEQILGGRGAADTCKRDLLALCLIATAGAGGEEIRFVVKRNFGDDRRAVVAVRTELLG